VVLPKWWRVYHALSGVINPILDRAMTRDDELQSVLRDADRPERVAERGGAARTPGTRA
jgi:hypothetical protein